MNQKSQSQLEQELQAHKIARLIEFKRKKSVHVTLFTDTHKEFRKVLLDKDLSIQEVFERFAQLVNVQDKRAEKILDEIAQDKREKIVNRIANKINTSSVNDLYDAINIGKGEENV